MGPAATPARSIDADDAPIGPAEFADLIEPIGLFERHPALAVAVSGGADSLCLALLAHNWAQGCGGAVTGLIVDHGLRPESAREAATVKGWLRARGIVAVVLRWDGTKPASGIQEAAREARYRLLAEWCRAAGVLHLLLAHHRDDQIETVSLRAARGSGPDGLAAMSALVEHPDHRVLRPLLAVPSGRLRATLRALGQDWIEDPSNRNPAFARVRVRAALAGRRQAFSPAAGRDRIAAEAAVARLLAQSVAIHPEGWATVAPDTWAAAPRDLARRALVRVLQAVGGGAYPPRSDRLAPVLDALLEGRLGRGRTLAGCRLAPHGQAVLVAREAGRAASVAVERPGDYIWDDRFRVRVAEARLRLAPLGEEGWRAILRAAPEMRAIAPPFPASTSLPALFDLDGVRAVPHLMYGRRGADPDSVRVVSAMFRPRHALAGPGFALS
jgi:tRNA(Ile)-lysidine synthase